MKRTLSILLLAGFILGQHTFSQTPGVPPNASFSVMMKKDKASHREGWQWTNDILTFKSGKLLSKIQHDHEKFPATDCVFTAEGDSIIHFTGVMKNPYASNIQWEGNIRGKKIAGTAVWTNAQGVQKYTFQGQQK